MKRRKNQTETRCELELNKLGLNKLELNKLGLNAQKTDSNHRKDVVAVAQEEAKGENLKGIDLKTVTSAKNLVTEVIAVLSLLQLGRLLLRKLCL